MADWRLRAPGDALLHVVPIDDLREHMTDDTPTCWCNPELDEGVVIHNSMDGRELYERGERKPS